MRIHQHPLHLGLTGGIGSGKSTVAALLAQEGAALIDADAIAKGTTAPDGAAISAIAAQFGADYLGADGGLDRARMRERILHDPSAKLQLERIVHPLVGQQIAQQASAAQDMGVACIVYDIPLLVESGHWAGRLDRVLVVDCSVQTQIERVRARSAWAVDEVEKIIAVQATRAQRLAVADAVLYNEGVDLAELAQMVQQIALHFGLSLRH